MKTAQEAVVRFVALLALLILLLVAAVYALSFVRCFGEAKLVPDVPAYPVVRVLFYGSGRGSVSARFSLYDTAGREFSVIDRSWSADSLVVDFATARFSGKSLAFPLRIRAAEKSGGGIFLPYYYSDRKQCMLLGAPSTAREKLALFRLMHFALTMTTKFPTRFSTVETVHLGECEMGRTYDIMTDSDGLLTLVAM